MKKILFTIFVLCTITIVFFIFYIPKNIDRNLILYRSLTTYDDIVYKTIENNDLRLDICMPTTEVYDLAPMIFYVHGGSFVEGDKTWMTQDIGEDVAIRLLEEGYALISVNYRLLDEDTHFPANIIDIKDAIRYVNSVAGEYGLDPENIGIWGSNAGAYLALTVAYSPSGLYLGDYELRNYPSDVNYVIDLHGLTKMQDYLELEGLNADQLASYQEMLDKMYGPGMDIYNLSETDYETMSAFDPLSFVSDDTVPTIIIHGLNDSVVSMDQSDLLQYRLISYSIDYEIYKILGGNNGLSEISENEKVNVCDHIVDFITPLYVNNV